MRNYTNKHWCVAALGSNMHGSRFSMTQSRFHQLWSVTCQRPVCSTSKLELTREGCDRHSLLARRWCCRDAEHCFICFWPGCVWCLFFTAVRILFCFLKKKKKSLFSCRPVSLWVSIRWWGTAVRASRGGDAASMNAQDSQTSELLFTWLTESHEWFDALFQKQCMHTHTIKSDAYSCTFLMRHHTHTHLCDASLQKLSRSVHTRGGMSSAANALQKTAWPACRPCSLFSNTLFDDAQRGQLSPIRVCQFY